MKNFAFLTAVFSIGYIWQPLYAQCGSGPFEAEAVQEGNTWTVTKGGNPVWTGSGMLEAMRQAIGSLSGGRTTKERVVVRGSGSMPANQSLDLPSYTILDVCGTIDVTGSPGGDNGAIRGRNVHDVEVQHVSITGTPYFGLFFRNSSNVTLGVIDLRLSSGHGLRIDNDPSGSGNYGNNNRVTGIHIDSVYVSGTDNHGVETYGVEGITIRAVTARNVAYCGLLLNATIDATVGRVDADNAGAGTGYAAFRLANRAGRVGNRTNVNIHVDEVKARGGGRGFFCVSESGGAEIDRIDFANTGNNSILIENCYNVTVAGIGGNISGGGEVRIAARDEFANTSDVTFKNLTTNVNVRESPCGINTVLSNITLEGSARLDACVGITPLREPIQPHSLYPELTTLMLGSTLLLKYDPSLGLLGKTPFTRLTIATGDGKVFYTESIPESGKIERRIPLINSGVHFVTLENGRENITQKVLTFPQ